MDEQEDYDPEEKAFRLTAEKNDCQPLQEIRVDWDGSVVYREEPALLSSRHTVLDEDERDRSYDLFGVFNIEEDEVTSYLHELSQEVIDLFGSDNVRDYNIRTEEAWIEVTTSKEVRGVGLTDSPNVSPAQKDLSIPDFGHEQSILTEPVWDVWSSLVEEAEQELIQ